MVIMTRILYTFSKTGATNYGPLSDEELFGAVFGDATLREGNRDVVHSDAAQLYYLHELHEAVGHEEGEEEAPAPLLEGMRLLHKAHPVLCALHSFEHPAPDVCYNLRPISHLAYTVVEKGLFRVVRERTVMGETENMSTISTGYGADISCKVGKKSEWQ